jgi:murein DD-endopeptidase MepM/ murein hydrolase activator NlpD
MINTANGFEAGIQGGRQASAQAELQSAQQRLQNLQEAGGNREELKQASQNFEALFIKKLWQQMRKTLPEDGMLRSGMQEKYLSMFDQEFSRKMAEAGGIGLSRMIMNSLEQGLDKGAESAALNSGNVSWPEQDLPLLPQQEQQGEQSQGNEEQLGWRDPERDPLQRVEALAQEIVRRNSAVNSAEDPAAPGTIQPDRTDTEHRAAPARMPELVSPVQGEISSEFGWRQDPFTGDRAWHSGVDYAAAEGSSVKACWSGEVVFAGENKGYGKQVVIKHDQGWQSVYAHNSENLVSPGDQVQAGQEIAKVGDTGRSTGPHLHFELKQGDMAWDPKQIEHRILAGLQVGKRA